MVTLRGKKANAKAKSSNVASDKPATPAAAALASAAGKVKAGSGTGATVGAAGVLTAQQAQAQELRKQREEEEQQKLLRQREERVLQLLKFTAQSALALKKIPDGHTIGSFCSTLLTALCGTGKDKKATPQQIMEKLTRNVRKRVCGAIFSSDEISYSCRNCQVDSTCVICQDCFAHRYAVYLYRRIFGCLSDAWTD